MHCPLAPRARPRPPARGPIPFGEDVYSYGNSSLRLGIELLSPKTGTSLGSSGDGWTFGVLSTLALAPLAGSNGVSDLRQGLAYANAGTSDDWTLAPGTEPFVGYP